MTTGELYAVIPAGGSGTRLWPLSRADYPKFLHALTGPAQSMLQATVSRLAPLSSVERTFVVTGAAHAAAVARQLPTLPEVGGDAVAYTGPEPDEIARDLGALLDDTPRRRELSAAGLARAKEFTWDASAEAHLAAWSRAAAATA